MRRLIGLILVVLTCVISAQACTIPVYRYALERWETDFYRMIIFYDGELSPGFPEELSSLVNVSFAIYGDIPVDVNVESTDVKANISLRFANLADESDPQILELWQTQNHPELPWVVIRFPSSARLQHVLWRGPLDALPVDLLVDSPARNEVVEHLSQGQSAVWVLLEVGDKEKDEHALQQLTQGLKQAKTELKLPEIGEQDQDEWLSGEDKIPLKIDFHIVRVSRSDPKEIPFITMLIKSYPELAEQLQEPMAFPIFGRGRVLTGLVGEEIKKTTVIEVNRFLIDSCQCVVKEENPGVDLLMTADWDKVLEVLAPIPEPEFLLTGVSNFLHPNDATVMPTSNANDLKKNTVIPILSGRALLLLGCGFVFIAALSLKIFVLNK